MINKPVTLHLMPREDGGLRIRADELPGLVLSNIDQVALFRDLPEVIHDLIAHGGYTEQNPASPDGEWNLEAAIDAFGTPDPEDSGLEPHARELRDMKRAIKAALAPRPDGELGELRRGHHEAIEAFNNNRFEKAATASAPCLDGEPTDEQVVAANAVYDTQGMRAALKAAYAVAPRPDDGEIQAAGERAMLDCTRAGYGPDVTVSEIIKAVRASATVANDVTKADPVGKAASPRDESGQHYASAQRPDAAMRRTFWVVERFDKGTSAGYWDGGHSRSFVSDIENAIQFCRKQDTFWVARHWYWTDVQLTEHVMLSTTLPRPDAYVSAVSAEARALAKIADIIDGIDNRCMACDGPVTPTDEEITLLELQRIYGLAKAQDENWRPLP